MHVSNLYYHEPQGRLAEAIVNLIAPGKVFFAKVHLRLGTKIRYFITGGSRFDPKIGRDLEDMGFSVLQAYGLTETTGGAFSAQAFVSAY